MELVYKIGTRLKRSSYYPHLDRPVKSIAEMNLHVLWLDGGSTVEVTRIGSEDVTLTIVTSHRFKVGATFDITIEYMTNEYFDVVSC